MSTQIAGYRVGPCPPEFRAIAQEDYADYAASLSRSSRTSTGPGSGPTTTTERMLLGAGGKAPGVVAPVRSVGGVARVHGQAGPVPAA